VCGPDGTKVNQILAVAAHKHFEKKIFFVGKKK
jgi:hypothetical protein